MNTNFYSSSFDSSLGALATMSLDQLVVNFLNSLVVIIIGVVFLWGILQVYLNWLRQKWSENHKYILLAIDIPKLNEQSPMAVENMFTYLGGAHGSANFFEKWFIGEYQKSFSYEIISLEGYTQFLIHTPIEYRNLIESSVYSQYPDAEISEVDDYTQTVPQNYPNEDYDIWGTEFIQSNSWVYPIKRYMEFEHKTGPTEMQFKDPMATLMDLCGSLRQGEQLWLQYIVTPIGFDWVKEAEKEIDKILGRKTKAKKSLAVRGVEALGEASEFFYSIWGDIEESKDSEDKTKTMFDLTPIEVKRIESIHQKLSKISFAVKIRAVYVAKKEVMNKAKVANGLVGFIKQFATLDINNLRPDLKRTMTKTNYFRKKSRLAGKKRRIFTAYKERSADLGVSPGIYNIEELATLWHFPLDGSVRSPLIQKSEGKKAEAPSSLPLASLASTSPGSSLRDDIFKDELFTETTQQVNDGSQQISLEKNDFQLRKDQLKDSEFREDDSISLIINNDNHDDQFIKTDDKINQQDKADLVPDNLPFV